MKTIKNLTADQIRKSILQLAIQGKLVKQDPNDEPASELVKRIYEEKHKLIKKGKIKKDKNESYIYKGDDNCYYEKIGKSKVIKLDNLPFEIPDNWSWIRLSSFCDIYTGDSINENDKNKLYRNRPEGYDYIGTKDVNFNHSIVYENGVKIPYSTGFKICPKSKILLCIEGGSAGRKIAFTSKDVCFGNKLACFNSWTIDDRYLYLFLQSPLFLQLFKDKLTGIISGVSINNLKQLFLPLPPLGEQERIVEKFKSCEPLLSRYELIEQNITLLETSLEEKLKASILQYAIEGKLVKQDPNDEPASVLLEHIKAEKEKLIKEGKIKRDKHESEIVIGDDKNYYACYGINAPSQWCICCLSSISIKIVDGNHNPPRGIDHFSEYMMLSSLNIDNNGLVNLSSVRYLTKEQFIDENKRTNIQLNDILLTTVGSLGRCFVLNKVIPVAFQRSVSVITTLINPQFLRLFFLSPSFQKYMQLNAKGTAQKGFYLNQLSDSLIAFPSLKEQDLIVKIVESILNVLS